MSVAEQTRLMRRARAIQKNLHKQWQRLSQHQEHTDEYMDALLRAIELSRASTAVYASLLRLRGDHQRQECLDKATETKPK